MTVNNLQLVSADSHVDEPHDLWFDRLPERLRGRAPRKIARGDEGAYSLVVEDNRLDWVGSLGELTRIGAIIDASERQAVLDADQVLAEVIYPTIGLYVWDIADPELGRACCRVYNEWIMECLGDQSPRFRCAAMIPTWDVESAIAEVHYAAARGFGVLMLPLVGAPEWNHRDWEPLWSAIASAGLPIALHQGSGHDMLFYKGWGAGTTNLIATQTMAPRAVSLFVMSGILERHPALSLVFVEVNGGWLAWLMSTLDEYYEAHNSWAKPKLAESPSAYVRRQVHVTFQRDEVAFANLALTGPEPLLWGSDYPHPEGTYPNSVSTVTELIKGIPKADAAYIVGGHAVTLFGFDRHAIGMV